MWLAAFTHSFVRVPGRPSGAYRFRVVNVGYKNEPPGDLRFHDSTQHPALMKGWTWHEQEANDVLPSRMSTGS